MILQAKSKTFKMPLALADSSLRDQNCNHLERSYPLMSGSEKLGIAVLYWNKKSTSSNDNSGSTVDKISPTSMIRLPVYLNSDRRDLLFSVQIPIQSKANSHQEAIRSVVLPSLQAKIIPNYNMPESF